MSEWWTYRLSDFLMFSPAIYGRMVERYQQALWPAGLLLTTLGGVLLALAARPPRTTGAVRASTVAALVVLALVWTWVGWAFHAQRFAQIHTAAPWLAAGWGVQAVLLLLAAGVAAWRPAEPGSSAMALRTRHTGLGLALVGLLLWPALSGLWGQSFARAEAFGLMPEPTAWATLGVLAMLQPRGWRGLCVIPLLSLVIGGLTLWAMAG